MTLSHEFDALADAAKLYMERVPVDGESNYQLEAYYALRDALNNRALKAAEWHPIETAPKDGTPILVFDPRGDGEDEARTTAVGRWGQWSADGEIYCWLMEAGDGWVNPTHWRPLPTPPITDKES